jgi:hypothetical protein
MRNGLLFFFFKSQRCFVCLTPDLKDPGTILLILTPLFLVAMEVIGPA